MDQTQHLKELENRVKTCTADRIRKEEQLKMLRTQRDDIVNKLREEGIEPETLESLLTKMRADLDAKLTEIENQISAAK